MVAILAGAAASPRDAPGWVHGADAIGMGETGVAAIGMAATGAVVTGMAATGTIGMGIGIITVTIMSSLLVTSAFHGRGVGAGDIQDITAMGIRTGTAMAIRTDTAAMVTEGMAMETTATVTAMDMGTVLAAKTVAANTALRLARE